MKFLAILRQDGGCDYTIGCGINTIAFEADSVVQAAEKLQQIVKENYTSDDFKLKSANFYQISATYEVDLNLWYGKFNKENADQVEVELRKIELAELERLKKKYNA